MDSDNDEDTADSDDMNDNEENDDSDDDDTAANNVPADTTTPYAMSDIAANNTESSCWTTIRGNVYNLSAWIDAHPG